MWININTRHTSEERPVRIRLENGLTLTAEEVTDEILEDAGWQILPQEEPQPIPLVE